MQQARAINEAFEAEMVPHMATLYNFALRLSRNPDDAKDLVQETYANAYRYFDKYQLGTNAIAWLYRIMKNYYINRYRKVSKEPEKVRYEDVTGFYPNIKIPATETSDLQERMLGSQFEDEVAQALENLQEEFRTVMILSDVEDYTYEEIANFVGIPVGTVRSRLHRGRKMLRSALRDYASNHGFRDMKSKAAEFSGSKREALSEV
jgi:RNA polymerase sigma-70 factor (ECF subfamily)